jgi:branched-chain amino acid transport system permease protein
VVVGLIAGLMVGGVIGLAGPVSSAPATPAQETNQSVDGVLEDENDEPIEGVTIVVEDEAGNEVETVETDADGAWVVDLPEPGSYVVTLDVDTLPEGVQLSDPNTASQEFELRAGRRQVVGFSFGEPVEAPAETPDDGAAEEEDIEVAGTEEVAPPGVNRLLQGLLNGLKFGLIIAMTAIGLSLIFGTTGLINFAHGDLVTLGAILAWYFNTTGPGLQLILAALVVVPLTGAVGGVLERGLWRPLRDRKVGLFQMLIISVGLGLVIRHLLLMFFGGQPRPFRDYVIQERLRLGPVAITPRDLIIIGISVALLVTVATMLQRTRMGKAMRAVSDNPELAEASGVDVKRVVMVVWVMGAGLAAVGGIFLGAIVTVDWLMGFQLLLLMFAGVILGGLGTAYGAFVGSMVVGVVVEVSAVWFPAEIKVVWGLAVLVAVLLLRPQGILGIKERIA